MVDSEMRESLQRFGWTAEGIARVEAFEAQTAEGKRAKRKADRKPVEQSALDFGDWE